MDMIWCVQGPVCRIRMVYDLFINPHINDSCGHHLKETGASNNQQQHFPTADNVTKNGIFQVSVTFSM